MLIALAASRRLKFAGQSSVALAAPGSRDRGKIGARVRARSQAPNVLPSGRPLTDPSLGRSAAYQEEDQQYSSIDVVCATTPACLKPPCGSKQIYLRVRSGRRQCQLIYWRILSAGGCVHNSSLFGERGRGPEQGCAYLPAPVAAFWPPRYTQEHETHSLQPRAWPTLPSSSLQRNSQHSPAAY